MKINRRQSHNIGTRKEQIEKRKALRDTRVSQAVYRSVRPYNVSEKTGQKIHIPLAKFVYVGKYSPMVERLKHQQKEVQECSQ